MGAMNLVTWAVLIASGQVPHIQTEIISYLFHWFSEFSMATLMIVSGFLILKGRENQQRLFYLAAGMLLTAIIGMVVYYAVNFDLVFFFMGTAITVLTILFTVANYTGRRDLLFFGAGMAVYGSINVFGNVVQGADWRSLPYIALTTLACGWIIAVLFGNNRDVT
jgi:hypothetical protein